MNSRKISLDPLAKRRRATKNIETRRNNMLRDELMTGTEDASDQEHMDNQETYCHGNKRKTASSSPSFYSKKACRNALQKTTGKQQENIFFHELRHSGCHPNILTEKMVQNYDTSLTSDESSSILDNKSDNESTGLQSSLTITKSLNVVSIGQKNISEKKTIESRTLSIEGEIELETSRSIVDSNNAHSFFIISDAHFPDRLKSKEDDKILLNDQERSIIKQNENLEEVAAATPENNDGIETRPPVVIDTPLAENSAIEHVETSFSESVNPAVLYKYIHLKTSDGKCLNEHEFESFALNVTTDVNSTNNQPLSDDDTLVGEAGVTAQNFDSAFQIHVNKDMESFSQDVVTINPSETPLDKDSDETRSLNSENDTSQQIRKNLSAAQSEKDNENDKFLDGVTIQNDFNLNQESLDLITEADLGIDLNDVPVDENVVEPTQHENTNNVFENAGTSSNILKKDYSPEKKQKMMRAAALFKNSCIDFLSDNDDFSPGSSDYWSPCESELSDSSHPKKKKIKKLKKKSNEKSKQKESNEAISKKKVNRTNKRKMQRDCKKSGKSYKGRGGNLVEEKSIKANPCVSGICARRCYEIPEDRRKGIFDFYWSLDSQHQRDWIILHSKISDIKRKKTKQTLSRRNKTIEYFINEGEGVRKVCQKFLMNTLDVSQKLLQYTNEHQVEGFALSDQRTFNGVIKYSEESKNYAREYLEKLPAVSSHYCRSQSKKFYLPQDFKNISNLYRLYSENCKAEGIERVSEIIFRKIFKEEYNLSFHVPKKDKCVQCIKAENEKILTTTEQENLMLHTEEKKASYHRFKVHQNLQSNDTVTTSFDLQKVLNTPYGESMLLYYARKYSMFNLTFYESQTQNGFCYLWGESDAKRGSNEVATCIIKYLQDVDMRKKKNVLLYCDACSGQNKNKVVISALHHFLTISKSIQVIQINFLLPGHSYMPVDSMHAVIEREVKRLIVWSPSQWPTYIEAARKNPFPYKVETIEYSDIIDWNDLATKAFQGNPIKDLRKVRVITLKKKDLKNIEIKYSMKESAKTQKIDIFRNLPSKKGKGKGKNKTKTSKTEEINSYENIQLQPLYTKQIDISEAEYNDLRKLCSNGTIPKRFHKEFLSLPVSKNVRDKLPETDQEEEKDDIDEEI